MPIAPGLRAGFSHTVTEADTALAAGSGDVPVLATPKVLALVERASVEAVAGARLAASGWVIRVVVDRAAFVRHAGAG